MMTFFNKILPALGKKLLYYSLVVVMTVSIFNISSFSSPLSAVAVIPVCDFSEGGSGLADYEAGRCLCDYSYYLTNSVTMYSPCPEECSETDLQTTLAGADNREKIFNFFIDQGLTPEQSSGIVGNIQTESGGTYSPTINEFSQGFPGGGYGIVQWTGGRRDNVVDYMTQKHPDLMSKYYKAEYSTSSGSQSSYSGENQGFVPKNALTGEFMPEADNDALLLAQLEFIIIETSSRTIRPTTANKVPGLIIGENEWGAVKKQTTIKGASDVWVYNFEIPADIDNTAKARVANGEDIFERYGALAALDLNTCNNGLVGATRENVVRIAEEEYAKWESGELKAGNDFRKYLEGNSDTEWCAYFVSWVYKQAGYTVTADGTPYLRVSQFENASDRFDIYAADGSYTPQPGDIVSYGYHTNLIVAVSADNPREFTTVGGNEGPASVTIYDREVKKTAGTYWASEAVYYIAPKG